jgi:hypothetical protein
MKSIYIYVVGLIYNKVKIFSKRRYAAQLFLLGIWYNNAVTLLICLYNLMFEIKVKYYSKLKDYNGDIRSLYVDHYVNMTMQLPSCGVSLWKQKQ